MHSFAVQKVIFTLIYSLILHRLKLRSHQNENPAHGRALVLLPKTDPRLPAHPNNVLEAPQGMCEKSLELATSLSDH